MGEICHIKAANLSGPRYDPRQTAVQRHGYDNLLLLCANHHTIIDDDPEAYTVKRLMKMKTDHEAKMKTDHEARKVLLSAKGIDHGTQLLIDQSVTTPVEMSLISGIGGSTCRSQPFRHPLKFYLLQARATDDEAARPAASPPD